MIPAAASTDVFSGTVLRFAANGDGIVPYADALWFVHGVIPGEKIVCQKKSDAHHRARLLEVREAAPGRTAPCCPHFGVCGGCSWQHIAYQEQTRLKIALLESALQRAGITKLPPITAHESPPYGYRDRFQFHRVVQEASVHKKMMPLKRSKPASAALALMARDSSETVPIADCVIANETIRTALQTGALKAPLYKDRFAVYGRDGVLLCEGGTSRHPLPFRAGGYEEKIAVDAQLFFQSNGILLEPLIERLLQTAKENDAEYAGDFYCGVGTFAVFLRHYFPKLDLLEGQRAALALCRENISGAGGHFYGMTDSAWVQQYGARRRYDFLCVDPGRQGLSPLMRQWLGKRPPQTLVYISCEPSALARDARVLLDSGFFLESLDFFDFYPQTARIESIAVFKPVSH